MEFVKGGVEFLGLAPSEEEAMLKMIETGGRTCYRSEDKTTSDSYKTFFKKIIGTKHLSVLEKSNICVKIPNSRNQQFYMYLTHLIYTSKQGGFFEVHMYRGDCYVAANLRAWLMFFVNSFKTLNLDLTENNLVSEFYVTLRTKYPFIFTSFEKTLENDFDEFFSQYKCSFDIEVIDEHEQLRLLIESDRVLNLPVFIFRAKTCRGIANEVVRNRSLSFLQESTRFVNYLKKFGLRFFNDFDRLEHNEVFDKEHVDKTSAKMMKLYNDIEETYNTLVEERETSDGAKKKLLRPEIARNILPNSLMAEIIIAGRLSDGDDFYGYDTSSQLTHFIKQRGSAAAHPDIRPIAASMFKFIDALINQ